MHYNTGYQLETISHLCHFVEDFHEDDVIVAPFTSCVGKVRNLYPKAATLSSDRTLIEAVDQLISRVYELSEFLVKHLGVSDVGVYYPHRVTYHLCAGYVRRVTHDEIADTIG